MKESAGPVDDGAREVESGLRLTGESRGDDDEDDEEARLPLLTREAATFNWEVTSRNGRENSRGGRHSALPGEKAAGIIATEARDERGDAVDERGARGAK